MTTSGEGKCYYLKQSQRADESDQEFHFFLKLSGQFWQKSTVGMSVNEYFAKSE